MKKIILSAIILASVFVCNVGAESSNKYPSIDSKLQIFYLNVSTKYHYSNSKQIEIYDKLLERLRELPKSKLKDFAENHVLKQKKYISLEDIELKKSPADLELIKDYNNGLKYLFSNSTWQMLLRWNGWNISKIDLNGNDIENEKVYNWKNNREKAEKYVHSLETSFLNEDILLIYNRNHFFPYYEAFNSNSKRYNLVGKQLSWVNYYNDKIMWFFSGYGNWTEVKVFNATTMRLEQIIQLSNHSDFIATNQDILEIENNILRISSDEYEASFILDLNEWTLTEEK